MKILYVAVFATLFNTYLFAQNAPWSPDVSNIKGQVEFLASLFQTHPEFPSVANSYLTNPIVTLERANTLIDEMAENANSLEINNESLQGIQYSSDQTADYSSERIAKFKEVLIEILDKIDGFEISHIQNNFQSITDNSTLDKLLRVTPLIYDSEGNAISTTINSTHLKDKLESFTPAQLDDLYLDTFLAHQFAIIEDSATKYKKTELVNSLKNQFIDKVVRPSFQMISKSGLNIKARTITIQKIPTLVSLFRGCIGGDCSMQTVNFYSLPKGASVYWIRKSSNPSAFPDGYIFIHEVKVGNKKVPYIVTINGKSLGAEDVRATLQLISKEWNTEMIVVPDFSKNPHVVNTNAVKNGLSFANFNEVEVDMGEGWSHISQSNLRGGGSNYYEENKISRAKSINLSQAEEMTKINTIRKISIENVQPYMQTTNITKLSKVQRAILAAQTMMNTRNQLDDSVARFLRINKDEADLAKNFINLNKPEQIIDVFLFEQLQRELNFKVEDLLHSSIYVRGKSIGEIYRTLGTSVANQAAWQKLSNETFKEIRHHAYQALRELNEGANPDINLEHLEITISSALRNMFLIPDTAVGELYAKELKNSLNMFGENFQSYIYLNALASVQGEDAANELFKWFIENPETVDTEDEDNFNRLKDFMRRTRKLEGVKNKRSYFVSNNYLNIIKTNKFEYIVDDIIFDFINNPANPPEKNAIILLKSLKSMIASGIAITEGSQNTFFKILAQLDRLDIEPEKMQQVLQFIRREELYPMFDLHNLISRKFYFEHDLFRVGKDKLPKLKSELIEKYIIRNKCGVENTEVCSLMIRQADAETVETILKEAREQESFKANTNRQKFTKDCMIILNTILRTGRF